MMGSLRMKVFFFLLVFGTFENIWVWCFAESLLLGSLLWFLGIMCPALSLPVQFQLSREAVPMGSVEDKGQKSVAPRGPGSKIFELWLLQSYVKSKRCKASKTKMKPGSLAHGVLVWNIYVPLYTPCFRCLFYPVGFRGWCRLS